MMEGFKYNYDSKDPTVILAQKVGAAVYNLIVTLCENDGEKIVRSGLSGAFSAIGSIIGAAQVQGDLDPDPAHVERVLAMLGRNTIATAEAMREESAAIHRHLANPDAGKVN